jgi:hypothetical protein
VEKASEAQLSHMDCDKPAKDAVKIGEGLLRVLHQFIALFKRDPGPKDPGSIEAQRRVNQDLTVLR